MMRVTRVAALVARDIAESWSDVSCWHSWHPDAAPTASAPASPHDRSPDAQWLPVCAPTMSAAPARRWMAAFKAGNSEPRRAPNRSSGGATTISPLSLTIALTTAAATCSRETVRVPRGISIPLSRMREDREVERARRALARCLSEEHAVEEGDGDGRA